MVLGAYALCARQDQADSQSTADHQAAAGRHEGQDKLELHVRIRSTQAASEKLREAVKEFSSSFYQLRVLEGLTYFSKQMFPLTGIKVLAFSLPYRWDLMSEFQAAISCLPNLRELQLYLCTSNATKHANLFLCVLQKLPKVTSLRVAARWYPLTLLASNLIHINNLEMTWKVTVDPPPQQLKYLCFHNIKHDDGPKADQPFEGYGPLFSELAASEMPVEIRMHLCNSSALPELPSNMCGLNVIQSVLKEDSYDFFEVDPVPFSPKDYKKAFQQFSMLKVLQLGDFLTDELITLLEGVVMPRVDTFGFIIDRHLGVKRAHHKLVDGEHIWEPSQNVYKLAAVFPELRHFKVVYTGGLKDTLVLMSDFMSEVHFPKLQGVTCCSHKLKIIFRNISPFCYLVNKLSSH